MRESVPPRAAWTIADEGWGRRAADFATLSEPVRWARSGGCFVPGGRVGGSGPYFVMITDPCQLTRSTRLRSRGKAARPYICRLIILVRLTLPSTTPELHGMVSPLSTAS